MLRTKVGDDIKAAMAEIIKSGKKYAVRYKVSDDFPAGKFVTNLSALKKIFGEANVFASVHRTE